MRDAVETEVSDACCSLYRWPIYHGMNGTKLAPMDMRGVELRSEPKACVVDSQIENHRPQGCTAESEERLACR